MSNRSGSPLFQMLSYLSFGILFFSLYSCVGITGGECQSGEKICVGNSQLKICQAGFWRTVPCPPGAICRSGACDLSQVEESEFSVPSDGGEFTSKESIVWPEDSESSDAFPDFSGGEPPVGDRPAGGADSPCNPGGRRCFNGSRQLCEGGRWLSRPCPTGSVCRVGNCENARCQEGSRRCLTGAWREFCRRGSWVVEECAGNLSCQFGECVPAARCQEGERRCRTSRRPQICRGGRWLDLTDCSTSEVCRKGWCASSGGCRENEVRCAGDRAVEICRAGTWELRDCPGGQVCRGGKCVTACKVGETRCVSGDGRKFERCVAGKWVLSSCPSGQFCRGGRCQTLCREGETKCGGGNTLLTCRGGQWVTRPCPSGQICKAGRCEPKAFRCQLPQATPQIATKYWIHPKRPYAGQTLTLSIQSSRFPVNKAPPIQIELINRNGRRSSKYYAVVGGKTLYYISIAGLAAGENCVVVRRQSNGNVEVALKVQARDPSPGIPRGNGVWKVVRNHQWTCSEQPTNGNFLIVYVKDERGRPVKGATVKIDWTDDTVFPIKPEKNAHQIHPRTMVTDANGRAELFYKPTMRGIRSPIDSKPGWLVYRISIAGGASDTATEITTGIWGSIKPPGKPECNYCNRPAVNVYGHWSYTIEFRRDPKAKEICDVPIDHQGQKACFYYHAYHQPGQKSCIPVAP